MQPKLSRWQRDVLNRLLDQYEDSKTYRGTNQVAQTFSVVPSKVFAEYDSDYADIYLVHDFERQMEEMEQEDLLSIVWDNHVIQKITANPKKWAFFYKFLDRKERKQAEQEQIELYKSFLGVHKMPDLFCREQIRRLEEGKKAKYAPSEAGEILKLWKFILENQEELLERELSIAVLGDSKLWERKYRSKVCRLMKKYGEFDTFLLGVDDEKEAEKILLGEYHVVSNPSYVYFKGNARLFFEDGQSLTLYPDMPIAFTEKTLKRIKEIRILTPKVMTVENLTSYNRLESEDFFYIFLSGYHNRLKQELLCRIYNDNRTAKWYHFGDIDPDGFYIIEHLKEGTGIDFEPLYMDASYLKKYDRYTKPLEENDITKAHTLLAQGKYSEVLEYMLREKKKLEQEIISWMEENVNQ